MKKLLKVFSLIVVALILIITAAFAYFNFVYLPRKVSAEGAAYLAQKSKGRVQAQTIQYLPFQGARLEKVTFFTETKKPVLSIDKLNLRLNFWRMLVRRELAFHLDLFLPKQLRPVTLEGLYRLKQKKFDSEFKISTDFFAQKQTIIGKVNISQDEDINLKTSLNAPDLNLTSKISIKGRDLRIEQFSAKILRSDIELIGDVQDLPEPTLNIYGNLNLDLNGLKGINARYSKFPKKLALQGKLGGKIYLSSKLNNPQAGLKLSAGQIMVQRTKIDDLSLTAKLQDKKLSLSKLYAKLCSGEIKLEGSCSLDSKQFPAEITLNVFNLELNKMIKDITAKDSPVHGRFFALARLRADITDLNTTTGKIWLSASGANILQFALFSEIAEILRLPHLSTLKFKEASGNFTVAEQQIRTADFKISGKSLSIAYKGYIDFAGNLSFDVKPSFTQNFFRSLPDIANILGIFFDSAGNFLGEIKLKGNLKEAHHSFKPFSKDKLLRKGIERGLQDLFKKFREEGE